MAFHRATKLRQGARTRVERSCGGASISQTCTVDYLMADRVAVLLRGSYAVAVEFTWVWLYERTTLSSLPLQVIEGVCCDSR